MTLSDAVNPNRWGEGWRWAISGVLLATGSLASTAMVQAYNFGVEREHQRAEFEELSSKIDETNRVAAEAAKAVADDLAAGRARALPRIEKLETSVGAIMPSLAQIEADVANIKETTRRHDVDIAAIRAAVEPAPSPQTSWRRGN